MAEIMTMGEIIVEIMRDGVDKPLDKAETFKGPYPSGAPAIFIDTVARLGHKAAIVGGVGDDDFGKCLLDRLEGDGVDCSNIIKNDRISTGCAFVTYFANGDRKFIFHIGNTPAVLAPSPSEDKLEGLKFFHIMGCSMMAELSFGRRIVETMKKAFESKGYNVGGSAFRDPYVNGIYASCNLASEQTPIYNIGNPKFGQASVNFTWNNYASMNTSTSRSPNIGNTTPPFMWQIFVYPMCVS